MECSLTCIDDPDCSVISWDENTAECSVLETDSLICDEDKFNSFLAFADPSKFPTTCEGIYHESL